MEVGKKSWRIGSHSSYFNTTEESGTNNSANNSQDSKGMSKAKAIGVLREPARKDAPFDLLLVNREDLMSGDWWPSWQEQPQRDLC